MEDFKKLFERFRDTEHDIRSRINTVSDRKEYEDLNIRSCVKGERFACRNYLSDWYSNLTEEQKELIAEFQVLLGSAIIEDKKDKEYNLNIPDVLHDNNSFNKSRNDSWKVKLLMAKLSEDTKEE